MKKLRSLVAVVAIAVMSALSIALPASAGPVKVIDFSDLTPDQPWAGRPNSWGDVPAQYSGFEWEGDWEFMSRPAYNQIYGQNEPVPNDHPNFAYSGHGTNAPLTVSGIDHFFRFVGGQCVSVGREYRISGRGDHADRHRMDRGSDDRFGDDNPFVRLGEYPRLRRFGQSSRVSSLGH